MQQATILSSKLTIWIGAALVFALALVGCDRSTPEERLAKKWREHHQEIVIDIRNLVTAGRADTALGKLKDYQSAGVKDPRLEELSRILEASRVRSLAANAQTPAGKMAALARLATLELATAAELDELKRLQQQRAQETEKQAQEAKKQAQEATGKKSHDTRLQIAILAARTLKRAMKDPEAFQLKSLLVMQDGTGCYEYRAKNSFGAILPSSAVLTSKGKMLLQERDGNAFVSAWNKKCTVSGGIELVPLIDQQRLLD